MCIVRCVCTRAVCSDVCTNTCTRFITNKCNAAPARAYLCHWRCVVYGALFCVMLRSIRSSVRWLRMFVHTYSWVRIIRNWEWTKLRKTIGCFDDQFGHMVYTTAFENTTLRRDPATINLPITFLCEQQFSRWDLCFLFLFSSVVYSVHS